MSRDWNSLATPAGAAVPSRVAASGASNPGYPHSMATCSARAVAAEIRRRVPGVPVKKLHKLLYYCQGHYLAAFGDPLFSESISAWDMGPVVGELWYSEKQGLAPAGVEIGDRLPEAVLNTIGYVISRYGRLSGLDLEHLTHSEPPWSEADRLRHEHDERSARLSDGTMRDYFRSNTGVDEEPATALDSGAVAGLTRGARERLADHLNEDDLNRLRARALA